MLLLLIHMLHTLFTHRPSAGRGVVRRGFGNLYHQTQRIPVETDRPGSHRSVHTASGRVQGLMIAFLLFIITSAGPAFAYDIDNSATVDLVYSGVNSSLNSNTTTVAVNPTPTPAVVELLHYQANPGGTIIPSTDFSDNGTLSGSFATIFPIPGPGDLTTVSAFSGNELLVIRLTDGDRNTDPTVINVIQLTVNSSTGGDNELLELRETGVDTGIFLGCLPLDKNAPVAYDGKLIVSVQDLIRVDYTDPINGDTASDSTLVDPYGFVFDSLSGALLDGAEVILIDVATGVEATTVVGDDGAPYPGRVTTGSSFTAGSLTYNFPPGGYRFPTIPTGDYSLQVVPPDNYNFPSAIATPAGSYVVVVPDSYGGNFTVNTGAAIRIDIPVDPVTVGSGLWLQLSTPRHVVGLGDFVPYSASVENVDPIRLAPGLTISQTLPTGFSYRRGTTRLDGVSVVDPTIGADGRTLTFAVGDLIAGATASIDFIANVSTASSGKYPSTAVAEDTAGVLSNQAEVTVLIRDDLFTNRAFLAGRVVQLEQCGNIHSAIGVPDIRLFLEDGTFIITDTEGRYHIEGLKPGTHVVQLDPITIPGHLKPVLCDDQTRFANTPSSQFIDLQGGTLWQADFYLADNKTDGEVGIILDNRFGSGNTAIYTVQLSGLAVPVKNLKLDVTLPDGITFLTGSATAGNEALSDPAIDGNRLTFALEDHAEDWMQTITFNARIDSASITREMRAGASLTFDTFNDSGIVTPESKSALIWIAHDDREQVEEYLLRPHFDTMNAELSNSDIEKLETIIERLEQLDILHIVVSGHTDARKIRWHQGILYKDNYELSRARARTIADRLANRLDIDPGKIVSIGHAATVPISDNETDEGRYLNRRTELKVYHLKRYPLAAEAINAESGLPESVSTVFRPVNLPPPPAKPEDGMLSQYDGQKLAHSIESVRVRLDARLTPQLLLDGVEIPAERIGFSMQEKENGTQLLSYIGVDFGKPGVHTLQIKGIGPFGNARFDQSITIIRTGPVERIEIADISGNLADGRTPLRIQLHLYDAAGERIEAITKLELRRGDLVPHSSEASRLPRTPETGMVSIDADGIALFDPVGQSGNYPITLGFGESEVELDIHVKPEQREWILIGLGDGTIGHNSISGNIQTLPDSVDEDFYSEGRVAFFARGQIKGEWLLTIAYDSDKDDRRRSLHQIIDPDSYYTLYGDSTNQGYGAASSEKLYVRVERDRFYAVFGDYETGLTTTELSRYSRSLSGIKSEYAGSSYGYSAFASETEQTFVRDEIRGDGTSGLYRLTQNDIVLNSEKIVIEVRDRYHSERIVSSRSLQRHIDYNIDYDNGTLFFKQPIVSRDENFNPVTIVVDYETFGDTGSHYQYGGRAYLRAFDQKLEIGASIIHEGLAGTEGDLYGADATWRLTPSTRLSGEYASSEQTSATGTISGSAWLSELQHTSQKFDIRAYYREQQANFGLGQQNASEDGTRKYGVDGGWRFSKQLEFTAEGFRQENLLTDANRTVAAANFNYTEIKYKLTAGLRNATDRLATGEQSSSNQVIIGADWYATKKLTIKARHEQSVGSDQSSDYPTRSLIGIDYIINKMITTFAQQEFTFGDNADTASTRLGLRTTPWDGFQTRSSIEQQLNEQGRRVFGNLGLTQSWQVTPYWSADVSLDRSQTIRGQIENPIHPDQPAASGSDDDFTAISIGSNLRKQLWMWDSRIEFRSSDTEDRWGLHSGYTIEPRSGLGLSLGLFLIQENRKQTGDRTFSDLRFGLAWRPKDGAEIILNRLDLITERDFGATLKTDSWRIINRLKGHWRLSQNLNLALQYGSKYVKETINSTQLSGYTDSPGGELRYDLNSKWDIGLHAAALHQWEAKQMQYRSGLSVGHSPATNFWISLGYNFSGFYDENLSGSDHTAQGAFLKFRFKFDQNSVKDTLNWLNRI
jgi:outer membrane protein OmpA-like peptidoglycan-associated protein